MQKEVLLNNCRLITAGIRTVYYAADKSADYNNFVTRFMQMLTEHINKFSAERLKGLHNYQDVLYKAFLAGMPRVASDFLKYQLLIAAFTELLNEAEKQDIYRRTEENACNPQPLTPGGKFPQEL